MTPPRTLTTLALACIALAAGCGGDDDGSGGEATDRPTVVATTGFAADLVGAVAGDDAEVVQLVPDSANPHSYSASARDRAELDRADLVVAFGRGYEEALPLDEVAERVEIADHVGGLRRFAREELPGADDHGDDEDEEHGHEDEEHGHEDEDHGHDPGGRDPHVWMDPTRLAAAAPAIANALARVDSDNAAAYRERARAYARELTALDRELRDLLEDVPADRRKLVTSHESMGYFADRYGFEIAAAPFGLSPEAEPTAQDVAEVIATVRAEQVPVVFAQQGDDPKVMRRIAEEADVEIVDDLLVENPGPEAETYADAMRHNARRIAEALTP